MPVTATASLLGHRQSVVRNTTLSNAGLTSLDVLTVNHGLGVSPDKIIPVLRSVIAAASAFPAVAVQSWDATKAILVVQQFLAGAPQINIDVLCEAVHSVVA